MRTFLLRFSLSLFLCVTFSPVWADTYVWSKPTEDGSYDETETQLNMKNSKGEDVLVDATETFADSVELRVKKADGSKGPIIILKNPRKSIKTYTGKGPFESEVIEAAKALKTPYEMQPDDRLLIRQFDAPSVAPWGGDMPEYEVESAVEDSTRCEYLSVQGAPAVELIESAYCNDKKLCSALAKCRTDMNANRVGDNRAVVVPFEYRSKLLCHATGSSCPPANQCLADKDGKYSEPEKTDDSDRLKVQDLPYGGGTGHRLKDKETHEKN